MTSLHADEAFVEHYQLNHDPFTPRVPGFKFFPAQRKSVLAQLHQLARYSAQMLVVSGPPGSGKTLLRQALIASSKKQNVLSVAVSASQVADVATLLRTFAHGLGGHATDLDGLLGVVARLNQAGQEVYLVVDDAEKLASEALVVLEALAAGDSDGRAHVFLFGEPQLLAHLEAAGVSDGCHVQELQPYNLDETCAYLALRLEGAGQGVELFDEQQLQDIHADSGGWPGAINRVAREALIESMLAEERPAQAVGEGLNLPKKHLLALGVVAIGMALALVLKGGAPESPDAVAERVAPGAPTTAPAIEFGGDGQSLPLPLVGQGQSVSREPLARAAGQAAVEELDAAHAALPAAPLGAAGTTPALGDAALVAPSSPAPVAAPALPSPAVTAVEVEPAAAPAPAPAPAPVPAARPVPQPVAAMPPAAEAVPAPAAASSNGGWYLSQPVGQYTLQLFGTASESAAQDMVREGGGDYRYFRKLHQGKPLYVVTYGRFASPEAAKSAVTALPARLQAGKPWPRTFASIQQEIRQAGR